MMNGLKLMTPKKRHFNMNLIFKILVLLACNVLALIRALSFPWCEPCLDVADCPPCIADYQIEVCFYITIVNVFSAIIFLSSNNRQLRVICRCLMAFLLVTTVFIFEIFYGRFSDINWGNYITAMLQFFVSFFMLCYSIIATQFKKEKTSTCNAKNCLS